MARRTKIVRVAGCRSRSRPAAAGRTPTGASALCIVPPATKTANSNDRTGRCRNAGVRESEDERDGFPSFLAGFFTKRIPRLETRWREESSPTTLISIVNIKLSLTNRV
jgi:hypothetical protein